MGALLKGVALFGVLLFGGLLAITFLSPQTVEKLAQDFIKKEIAHELQAKQQAINESAVAEHALKIADKLGVKKEKMLADLNNQLPEKIAAVLADLCGYDCEKRKLISASITSVYQDKISQIQVAENTLGNIIKGKYLEIVGNLMRDIRVFLGSNLLLFFLILLVSLLKPRAKAHLVLPTLLLVVATVVLCSVYLFGQNWFYTILYNDYMGFAYLAYCSLVFAFLMDIVLNRARVITNIVNALAEFINVSFELMPCP